MLIEPKILRKARTAEQEIFVHWVLLDLTSETVSATLVAATSIMCLLNLT